MLGLGLGLMGRAPLRGTSGPRINLSSSTIADTASVGTTVGTLSVSSATGTPTFTLASNPGGLFSITGSSLKVAASLSAGSDPITVHVTGMTPTTPDRAFLITVTHTTSTYVPTFELLGF